MGWHDAGHISACLGEKWGYQQGQDITVLPQAPLYLGSTGREGGRAPRSTKLCSSSHPSLGFGAFSVWLIGLPGVLLWGTVSAGGT